MYLHEKSRDLLKPCVNAAFGGLYAPCDKCVAKLQPENEA